MKFHRIASSKTELRPVMPNTNLEELRKKNIQRNRDLLKSLKLDQINDSLSRVTKPKIQNSGKASSARNKKPPQAPIRRSQRLNSTPEAKELHRVREEEIERDRLREKRVNELRQTKLIGNYSLFDILAEKSLGNLKYESRVLKIDPNFDESILENKTEDSDRKREDLDVLARLLELGGRYSAGDFYETIELVVSGNHQPLRDLRKEFNSLTLNKRFEPSKVKLVNQRITSILFHPAQDDRLVFAGDTNGTLGIWAVDSSNADDDIPVITTIKPHGRTISRITEMPSSPNRIVSVSYDGSARMMDIHKQTSIELFSVSDQDGETLGISDVNVHLSTPQSLVVSTLEGHLFQCDTRAPKTTITYLSLLRLHDKKIGGFSINPNREYQIATASLDRSFRIWDLRYISQRNSYSDIDDKLKSPHLYGSYSSRLSVSNVDWNSSNRLVCNGYDDQINIFDLSGDHHYYRDINQWGKSYVPVFEGSPKKTTGNIRSVNSIHHNCQSGRWVSILKARWQMRPADSFQKFVIANMKRSFDIYSQHGELIANLKAPEMTAVPAVVSFHPSQNWIIGGTSSGKVFLWE